MPNPIVPGGVTDSNTTKTAEEIAAEQAAKAAKEAEEAAKAEEERKKAEEEEAKRKAEEEAAKIATQKLKLKLKSLLRLFLLPMTVMLSMILMLTVMPLKTERLFTLKLS